MNTTIKTMKTLSREEMKNVFGGKSTGSSTCFVGNMWIPFNVPAGPAAISCGQTYGSSCAYCLTTS